MRVGLASPGCQLHARRTRRELDQGHPHIPFGKMHPKDMLAVQHLGPCAGGPSKHGPEAFRKCASTCAHVPTVKRLRLSFHVCRLRQLDELDELDALALILEIGTSCFLGDSFNMCVFLIRCRAEANGPSTMALNDMVPGMRIFSFSLICLALLLRVWKNQSWLLSQAQWFTHR